MIRIRLIVILIYHMGMAIAFFDPHGSTIDKVLHCIPEKFIDKVRVVRIGDAENPVPLNIWDSDDPEKEERTISGLCELFSDIFDPYREGFVRPGYERWLPTFCKASIAFLGRRASFESIAVISQSFNAITMPSVDGQQTKPFTLETERPKRQKNGEEISARIEQNSIERLVRPYRSLRALTPAEILDYLNHPDRLKSGVTSIDGKVTRNENNETRIPDWLAEWKKKRESIIKAS